MKNPLFKVISAVLFTALTVLPGISYALNATDNTSIFDGYYAREGNNGTPSRTLHHNVYMKLYTGEGQQWVALLHIPLPYASTVDEAVIPDIFKNIRKQINSSAFVRGKFGYLEEKATVQFERFGYMQDKIIFECGSLSPCSIIPADGYLELIKPGMINEHIIKYNHIVAQ
ncbi:MAG: hypothetical protein GQ573_02555 [Gammaproteobacteria bacterium]|nr:hypothetical protein [Gammaproteobacteria bacterium]